MRQFRNSWNSETCSNTFLPYSRTYHTVATTTSAHTYAQIIDDSCGGDFYFDEEGGALKSWVLQRHRPMLIVLFFSFLFFSYQRETSYVSMIETPNKNADSSLPPSPCSSHSPLVVDIGINLTNKAFRKNWKTTQTAMEFFRLP